MEISSISSQATSPAHATEQVGAPSQATSHYDKKKAELGLAAAYLMATNALNSPALEATRDAKAPAVGAPAHLDAPAAPAHPHAAHLPPFTSGSTLVQTANQISIPFRHDIQTQIIDGKATSPAVRAPALDSPAIQAPASHFDKK